MRAASTALALALASATAARAQAPGLPAPFPPGGGPAINLIQWTGNNLPPVIQRSEQLPLALEELVKLSKAGFDTASLVRMIEQRRCASDASADGLIALKQQGVPPAVIDAVSLHALRPHQEITLDLTLDFTGGPGGGAQSAWAGARESTLYLFVDDGAYTRVLQLDLDQLLASQQQHEELADRSDVLIERKVRRIRLAGALPLKSYGRHSVLVAASSKPTLVHPSGLLPRELARAQRYQLDYPRASLQSVCRLAAGWRRDAVLANKYNFQGSRFECEWN